MNSCPICQKNGTGDFCEKDGWIYCHCYYCDCLFLTDYTNRTNLDLYYKKDFQYSFDNLTKKRVINIANEVLLKLLNINPRGSNLLDIGSGHGYILEEAKKKNISPLGIEPSLKLYKETEGKSSVMNMNLDEFSKKNILKFDFITLSHVIEHLQNINILPDMLDKILNDNGIIFIETPNYDSWLRRIEKCEYIFLTPPDHTYVLSIKTIQEIFKRKKWKIIFKTTFSYPEHLIGILRRLKYTFAKETKFIKVPNQHSRHQKAVVKKRNNIVELLAPGLTNLLNFRNMGSIMQIYIRK